MSERDKKLLIYLGAFLVLAAAYFFVGKPFLDKIDKLTNEKIDLERELSKKEQASQRQDEYIQGIDEAKATFEKYFAEFPADNTDEKAIMFASKAEVEMPMWFSQIKFAEEEKMMINGSEAEGEEAVEASETTVDEASTEERSSDESGEKTSYLNDLMWRRTDLGLKFAVKYDGFKKFLAYIRDYDERIVIKELECEYENGIVKGSVILSQYAILGDDRELPDTVTDVKKIGTKNVFVNQNNGGSIFDLVKDIMVDLLSAVIGDTAREVKSQVSADYFVKLNAVTDNTNGITVGRGEDVIGATHVTSDENGKEEITFNIAGSEGEYRVTYSAGSHGYSDKIEKSADGSLEIRIISTERYSDDDKVAASFHIINKSDIKVNVSVEGDDSNNPRVDIVEKSGEVTVND